MSSSKPRRELKRPATPSPVYVPEFKGPIEGYVVNTIHRGMWRFRGTYDKDDMMQEAHIVFLRCAAKYPILDTPQHFMSLFKRAWTNRMNDLATNNSRHQLEVSEWSMSVEDDAEWCREHVGELENPGMLLTMLRQCPRDVMLVLNLFLNAPQELLDLATKAWIRRGRGGSEQDMVCALLGLDPGEDPLGKLKEYFTTK